MFEPPCSIARGCLWSEAQLKGIGDSHQTVWEHDYQVVRTEWDCALKEDHSSLDFNKMMVRTDQLLCIKEITHSKSSHME